MQIADVIRGWKEAHNQGDVARIVALYSDQCIIKDPLLAAPVRGKKAIHERTSAFFTAFQNSRVTTTAPVISGWSAAFEWVLVGTQTGPFQCGGLPWTIAPTGRDVCVTGSTFTKHDSSGLVIEENDYWDVSHITMLDLNLPVRSDLEFLNLVHSALRRSDVCSTPLVLGDVVVDFSARRAASGPVHLDLTHREFELLRYLADRPHLVVSRDELLQAVWGYRGSGTTRVVDQTVARLRRKIERSPAEPQFLHTARGDGYYLAVERASSPQGTKKAPATRGGPALKARRRSAALRHAHSR